MLNRKLIVTIQLYIVVLYDDSLNKCVNYSLDIGHALEEVFKAYTSLGYLLKTWKADL